ncbi:Zn-ribbon domain-containing OB-fold protein [Microbacterium sp.]|uniref:Zn-ribbon domain-containing OB-fold protein n=1 Tax=Microbacterium sp. TaxID=51671 RepID=UPI003A84AEDF
MTAVAPAVPKPALTTIARTQPWWDAAAAGRLLLQRCAGCGHTQHYPRVICGSCWSEDLQWVESAGTGAVRTLTVAHVPGHPAWRPDAPYVLALVRLDEGPCLMTNIVGCPVEAVTVDARVRMATTAETTEPGLIQFVLDA